MGDVVVLNSWGGGTHTVAEVNRKGGESALLGNRRAHTADHCKVLNVGQTDSSPQRSLSSAHQKRAPPTLPQPPVNDVNVGDV